jgi:hypothetical protein
MVTIWRGPDGQHWAGGKSHFDQAAGAWAYTLDLAEQDPATGRWAAAPGGERTTAAGHPQSLGYIEVSADPRAEPRVAQLHALIVELLNDYQHDTGHPHPRALALAAALEDVAAIPQELRRRGYAAASQAARSGFHRGRGR